MKPAWDQLMKDYVKGEDILVADVDCTAGGEQLCNDHEIRGYPTLKYGDPDALEEYEGGVDYEDLAEFAKEHLGPGCGVENLDLCDDEVKAKIEALITKGLEKIGAEIKELRESIDSAEEHFHTEEQKLQDKYEKLMEEKDAAIEAGKPEDFVWKEIVLQYLEGENSDEEEYDEEQEYDDDEYDDDEYDDDEFDDEQEFYDEEENVEKDEL